MALLWVVIERYRKTINSILFLRMRVPDFCHFSWRLSSDSPSCYSKLKSNNRQDQVEVEGKLASMLKFELRIWRNVSSTSYNFSRGKKKRTISSWSQSEATSNEGVKACCPTRSPLLYNLYLTTNTPVHIDITFFAITAIRFLHPVRTV